MTTAPGIKTITPLNLWVLRLVHADYGVASGWASDADPYAQSYEISDRHS